MNRLLFTRQIIKWMKEYQKLKKKTSISIKNFGQEIRFKTYIPSFSCSFLVQIGIGELSHKLLKFSRHTNLN